MFDAKQLLKLSLNEKANFSNSSQQSVSSLSVTLKDTFTPTVTGAYTPTFLENINNDLSLSSVASMNNSQYTHHSNMSSSHTIQLNPSETALTPNITAISPINNAKINNNFSLDSIECEDIISETKDSEIEILETHGYKRGKQIAETLQGYIYELESVKNGKKQTFVVKQTDKQLHSLGITFQNGKKYSVKEDILNEKAILELISNQSNAPAFMVKYIEFFESDKYYYLVMEHGGSDLFEFVIEAHKHIQSGILPIKEWRKFIKYIFWQCCVLLLWLHNTCNACHLDISLENILIKNAQFIPQSNGLLSISTNIQIKFCDFGLAEFYCIDYENMEYIHKNGFKSSKYCGKTNYKSPQIYEKQNEFDARKADVYSLGIVLFCMAIGAPPYKRPNKSDECFENFIKKGNIAQLLYQWKRHSYVTERMLSLLKHMLKYDENKRFSIDSVIEHPWLRTYYTRYYNLIKSDLIENKLRKN